jgi:hypothetical protein
MASRFSFETAFTSQISGTPCTVSVLISHSWAAASLACMVWAYMSSFPHSLWKSMQQRIATYGKNLLDARVASRTSTTSNLNASTTSLLLRQPLQSNHRPQSNQMTILLIFPPTHHIGQNVLLLQSIQQLTCCSSPRLRTLKVSKTLTGRSSFNNSTW